MSLVVGGEKKLAADAPEIAGPRAARSRQNILDHHRSGRRAIGLPKFIAIDSVVGAKKQGPANVDELARKKSGIGIDLLNGNRSRGRAVAFEERGAGREIRHAI